MQISFDLLNEFDKKIMLLLCLTDPTNQEIISTYLHMYLCNLKFLPKIWFVPVLGTSQASYDLVPICQYYWVFVI